MQYNQQMSGCRYERAIRQGLNKALDSKQSCHGTFAKLIAEYSHKTTVRPGDYMLGSEYHFFVVTGVKSQHWLDGYFCPPRLEFAYTSTGLGTFYTPDFKNRSRRHRKKVFSPFDSPFVKVRSRIFMSSNKARHEQMSHQPTFFD